ncbi:MAG: hypothetical protein J1F16_05470 [Muribaculaceae bacterium]|nr:hypothetical protein [Muribaculaceae bacterium]
MKAKPNICVQYINAIPSKKLVKLDEIYGYEFKNEEKIVAINIDLEIAFDYIMMITVDKMISSFSGIEKVALIRSNHPKYNGFQIIIDGDIRTDKSLIPKFITWEKLENHQKQIDDLIPIYED